MAVVELVETPTFPEPVVAEPVVPELVEGSKHRGARPLVPGPSELARQRHLRRPAELLRQHVQASIAKHYNLE
jgi:hypothetical protein